MDVFVVEDVRRFCVRKSAGNASFSVFSGVFLWVIFFKRVTPPHVQFQLKFDVEAYISSNSHWRGKRLRYVLQVMTGQSTVHACLEGHIKIQSHSQKLQLLRRKQKCHSPSKV